MDKIEIQKLRDAGLTFSQIGAKAGLTRQRIYQILHPSKHKAYQKAYRQTLHYKVYNKHRCHLKINKVFENCEKCNPL